MKTEYPPTDFPENLSHIEEQWMDDYNYLPEIKHKFREQESESLNLLTYDPPIDQEQLQDLVIGLLRNNPLLADDRIEVFVEGLGLSVYGKVTSIASKELVERIIKSFSCYMKIFNDLEIEKA